MPSLMLTKQGYDENMYLDAATRTYVEETGGANFIFVTKDGTVVTPKSDSILPSITRRSILYVAEHYLGLKTEERPVPFTEVKDFAECGLCGTAAVISPVGRIVDHGNEICFPSGMEKNGSGDPEALRHINRHPDGPHRGTGRLDPCDQIINRVNCIRAGFLLGESCFIFSLAMIRMGREFHLSDDTILEQICKKF